MGDPVSLILNTAGLIGVAAAIGGLVIAIDDFRKLNPGDEFKALRAEAESFGASCQLVGAQLERLHKDAATQTFLKENADSFRELLLDRCSEEIEGSSRTVEKLGKLIRDMDRRRKGWSKMEGLMKRSSLLWHRQDVEKLRQQISSHMNFLNMVLVTCNMYCITSCFLRAPWC